MQRRRCNNSDIELSGLGIGCWAFGGGSYWGNQEQKDVTDVVHASVDLCINYFDTAESYNKGRSEVSLGKAIKGIRRDEIIIGTKVSPSNCYKNTLPEHCEASLKRLQTGYIDLYMIHWPVHSHSIRHFTNDQRIIDNPPVIEESIEALQMLKQQGKIREFGVSNFSSNKLKDLPLEEVAVNELPYNLLCRAIEYDAIPYCIANGIGIIGYMALLQGILTDTYTSLDDIPAWRRRTRHFNSDGNPDCRHGEKGIEHDTTAALEAIRTICIKTGLAMCDIAIKWILSNKAITCSLTGSRNIRQLESNVNATLEPLNAGLKTELDRITLAVKEKLGNHFEYYESAEKDRT